MWTLLLHRQGDPPGVFLDRRQIDSGQIKIGRSAATCDWVLPDTAGHLSREHCVISAIGLDLFVVDTSTNGVGLNQPTQRIAPQTPVAIRIHDRLLIGDFAIEIATESEGLGAQLQAPAAASAAADPFGGFQQPDAWFDRGAATDPIWGTGPSSAEVHDFLGDAMHDFLAPPKPAGGGPAASFDPFGGSFGEAFSKPLLAAPIDAGHDAFAIPEDWAAPPAPATPSVAPAPRSPPPASADPFAGPITSGADPFGVPHRSKADPFAGMGDLPADDPFALPARGGTLPAAGDPFADFGPFPTDPIAPLADREETRPPPVVPPAPPAAPFTATPGATPTPFSGGAPDWAAFCEGAGIDPADLRTSPDAMRRLGVLYRQVVLGLSDLIQDRAAFKDEFRVERTQLSFGRNNPLKHLPPLESAKLLLDNPLPGFMGAEDAVRSGLEDVKKHQLALLAGVQHALRAVFQRLSPAEVDRVMKKATGEKRGFSFGRGVDPWSVYQTMFEALRTDATSNVNSVMSVAFREGYEAFLKSSG